MTASANAPRSEYPSPIGVLTTTLIAYQPKDRYTIVVVELQSSGEKRIVLPGGIFDVGRGRHCSQRSVAREELLEETGLRFASEAEPIHFGISQRLDVDPRRWCSFPTVNGANDYLMAVPAEGDLLPQDTKEVKRAFWLDVRTLPLKQVGRGHDLLIRLWKTICDCGGLSPNLFSDENRKRLTALSNERHCVSIGGLTNMIYLEDRIPVCDLRS